ncbi:MAG: phasin family protein [Deltaproteobacteria bacterium]|nr:phasin family protein [Deltaproteobacteria bacterium]
MKKILDTQKAEERLEQLRDDLVETSRNVLHAGLGAAAEADESSRGLYARLVDRGRTFQNDRKERLDERLSGTRRRVRAVSQWVSATADQGLGRAGKVTTETLQRFGIPTYEDIRVLNSRVAELNKKVEALVSK